MGNDRLVIDDRVPVVAINADDGRKLLALHVHPDGRLTAEYDAADLDEAAQVFVREVLRIASRGRL